MRSLIIWILFASIQTCYAQDVVARMTSAYLETDKTFDIDCRYSYNKSFKLLTPLSDTVKGKDFIKRDFTIESESKTAKMSFVLQRSGQDFEYVIRFNDKYISQSRLSKREFYISPVNDIQFANEFETPRIYCYVNFATSAPQVVNDGDYHINVHPHKIYDWQSILKTPVEEYLNNPAYESLILLESGNYRGNLVNINNFLNDVDYKLPQGDYGGTDLKDVPPDVPMIVAPAGRSRYTMNATSQLNVTFTGGNHNYCIWNNTRFVMEALIKSKSEAKLNIYYDTKATVAQVRGIEGLALNFPKRDINKSNLLVDLLKNDKIREGYHRNYHYWFRHQFFKEFLGTFKTVKFTYKAEGFVREDIIQGTGLRDLEINLIYLY